MSKAQTLASTVSTGGVLADGTVAYAEVTGTPTISTTAIDIAGGSAGTIPYQSAADTTAMLGVGTAGQVLQTNGAGAPTWVDAPSASPGNSAVIVNTSNGFGSTANKIRRFTTTLTSVGSDITYADSATNGASFTINSNGFYAITYQDGGSASSSLIGISINSSQLTTAIGSITAANRLANVFTYLAGGYGVVTVVTRCVVSDVIRPHTSGTNANTGPNDNVFIIRKVGVA